MSEPSRVRRQLGAELKAARTLAGLTTRELGELLGIASSTVTRLEAGQRALPSRARVAEWLTACSAALEHRQRVLALLEAAHAETRPWPDLLADGHLQEDARAQELEARLVRNYQKSAVPGLLQTAEYARLLAPQVDPTGQAVTAAFVHARTERQRLLYDEGRRFEFLLAESVLYWSPGPGVLPAQLDHIASLASLPAVELAVLPTRREGVYDWHGFVFTEPGDNGSPVVTAELLGGYWSASDPAVTGLYARLWDELWNAAAGGEEALGLVRAARYVALGGR
jgi:transcriptional regulator with XRE-family HTH domain